MTTENFDENKLGSISKNLILISTFFILTPLTLVICVFSLITISTSISSKKPAVLAEQTTSFLKNPKSGVSVYASLPATQPSITAEPLAADARIEIIRQYLETFDSPLTPNAAKVVQAADKYGIDFRLTTAIAQKESGLCKVIPAGTYNCWGWGIHEQGTLGFDSFEEGIEIVTKGLRENYLDKGLTTIEEIMSRYTPNSPEGAWAKDVTKFLAEME